MLELNKYIVAVKAIHGLAADHVFHRLAGNTGTKEHSINTWVSIVSFFRSSYDIGLLLNYSELVLLMCFVAEKITVVLRC